jgi:2-C-methyl-D-erythritol 4-phosphate cytidylyltransferase
MVRARSVWAVVVAGGSGARYGRAKQFDLLAGRPVVEWAVGAAATVADGVVLVLPPDHIGAGVGPDRCFGADVVVAGGSTRAASVRTGLAAVPVDADVVVVHDAARPLASSELFRAVVDPLVGGGGTAPDDALGGVICAVPVADTLKRVTAGGTTVAGTVDRAELVAVQTPQAFRAAVLRRAHVGGGEATDDAALVEALGLVVRVVPGEQRNLKVTTPADLAYLEHLVVGSR